MKRILVVGYGRAGKDESALMLSEITKIPYAGSTSWAAKDVVANTLGLHPQVAWEKRHAHRQAWRDICDKLREGDACRLVFYALQSIPANLHCPFFNSRGIVVGVRDKKEILAIKARKVVDYILWIERPGTPVDPTVTFTKDDCDEVIYNDGSLLQLHSKLFLWAEKRGLIPHLYLKPPTTDQFRE